MSSPHPAKSLRVVGLFAGIGGIEAGLASSGHRVVRFCEIDPAARSVLRKRFPDVPIDEDIRCMKRLPTGTDLVTAGFPCQDLSQVGRTSGLSGKHSSLIGYVFELLRKNPAPWVLLENVPFMLYLKRGRAMRKILSWLEELGYSWAYRIVDTQAFGLPHRRRRLFLVASMEGDPRSILLSNDAGLLDSPTIRNGEACGFYWTEGNRGLGWGIDAIPPLKGGSLIGIPSPPGIVLPGGEIVTPDIRDAERLQGFKPNWTRPAARLEGIRNTIRWKLVGNAVTVHVARWIGRRLSSSSSYRCHHDAEIKRNQSLPKSSWSLGEGRYASTVSEYPVHYKKKPLAEFIQFEPKPLSEKATTGFLNRVLSSNLTVDSQFVSELKRHVRHMRRNCPS